MVEKVEVQGVWKGNELQDGLKRTSTEVVKLENDIKRTTTTIQKFQETFSGGKHAGFVKVGEDITKVKYSTVAATDALEKHSSSVGLLNNQYIKFGLGLVGVQAGIGFIKQVFDDFMNTMKKSVTAYRDFDVALAQISTTLSGKEMAYMPLYTHEVQKMSIQFGKSAVDISKGLYEILSAATPVDEAINLLNISLKNAVAGLTDAKTSVAIMIDVMNAWGYSVAQMQHVSDVLFASVLRGTYTFDQLESAIGYVAPVASEAGVSLEEISAALSSATRRGMHLDSVTRGLSQIITSIINPTKEASDTAAQYGIMLGSAGLAVKGFSGFLKEVNEKIGENDEAIVKIFTNVRAYRVIMGLAGEGIGAFEEDLNFMTNSLGKMDEAFNKMTATAQMMSDVLTQATEKISRGFGKNANELSLFLQNLSKVKTAFYEELSSVSDNPWKFPSGQWFTFEIIDLFTTDPAEQLSEKYTDYMDTYAGNIKEKIRKMYDEPMIPVETQTPFQRMFGGENVDLSDELNATKEFVRLQGIVEEKSKAIVSLTLGGGSEFEIMRANFELTVEADNLENVTEKRNVYVATLKDAEDAVKAHGDAIIDIGRAMKTLKDEIGELNVQYDGSIGKQLRLAETTEALRLAEKKYNTEIKENSLALMQLQLMGMMRRRGNTRAEQRQMKAIEISNLQLRIKQQTETVDLEKAKEDAIDSSNAAELDSLRTLISSKEDAYSTYSTSIQTHYADMITAQGIALGLAKDLWGDESSEVTKMILIYNALNRARKGEIVGVGAGSDIDFSGGEYSVDFYNTLNAQQRSIIDKFPQTRKRLKYNMNQSGSEYIHNTGLAMVHRGEKIVPAGRTINNAGNTINISVNAVINKDMDIKNLASKLATAINSQMLNSNGTTKYGLR